MQRAWRILRRRLIAAPLVFLIVVLGTFLLLEASPGDAVDAYVAEIGGADAARKAEIRREFGLDRGPAERLAAYLGALARLDLGRSVAFGRPVLDVILERLPRTLILMGLSLALAFGLGTLLGIAAGARPGSVRDRALSLGSLVLYAVPSFWLGLVLIVVFAVDLRWLPVGGYETIASGKQGLDRAADIGRHLVLPVAALGFIYLALYLRLMRDGMVEIWNADFIRAARARGLPRSAIVFGHVARNALMPVVTMLGLQSAALLGGSVVIESVFAIPGLGRLASEAVAGRDAALLMGVVLSSAVMVILANLVVDIVHAALDPRVGSAAEEAA